MLVSNGHKSEISRGKVREIAKKCFCFSRSIWSSYKSQSFGFPLSLQMTETEVHTA